MEVLKANLKNSEYNEKVNAQPELEEFLLRVLRATMKDKKNKRIFQAKEALPRLEKIIDFKLENDVWKKPEIFDEFRKVYPRFAYKDKKANKLILFSRTGEFVTNGKFSHFEEKQWEKAIGFEMETAEEAMREISKETGIENRGYYVITDLKGLGLKAISNQKATQFMSNCTAENYPEMLDKVYLVNAPWIFEKIYGIMTPFLDKDTVSKFIISSGIPKEFKECLDMDALPKEFGGNNDIKVPYPKDSKKYVEELVTYDVEVTFTPPTN